MIIEITILTAPIAVSVEQAAPVVAEIGGIGTLIVNNYYSEGGAGGYVLTDADKAAIAALAAYDDTEVRALIDQRAQDLGNYIGQQLSIFAQALSETDQRSLQNASAIQSINTAMAMLRIAEVEQIANQNSQAISIINGTIGDIATILDALNGEVI